MVLGGLVVLWGLSGVLLPFVAALGIAYGFAPLVRRLEIAGVPRWGGAILVLVGVLVVVVTVLLLVVPLIAAQLEQLAIVLPDYTEMARRRLLPAFGRLVARLSPADVASLKAAAGAYAGTVVGWAGQIANAVLTQGLALFDVFSLALVSPVVAFYLLRDWDALIGRIDAWLPRRHAVAIRSQVGAIDRTLGGFLRGQAAVCLVLGLFYAIGLALIGLQFALIVGLLAGLLSFMPFVGSLFGLVLGTGLALAQFDDMSAVAAVVAILVIGQIIEGNLLQPKLVGESVGLHPVWIMIAIMAGGNLFGFLGVLVAVPVAAVLGVLARAGLEQYLASDYYGAVDQVSDPAADGAGGASGGDPGARPAAPILASQVASGADPASS